MKRIYCTLLLFCALLTTAYAQDSNNELLKKLVEKEILTQAEADEILSETKKAEQESKKNLIENASERVRNIFGNTPYFKLGGYGLFTHKYENTAKTKHTSDPRAIYLSAEGQITKTVRYYMLWELVNPVVTEFYGEWAPMDEFCIRFGQQKTPLTLENQLSSTVLETIYATRSISNLTGGADDVMQPRKGNSGGRDIGLKINGVIKAKLEYTFGLYQGTGISTTENNNTKDFAGSIMYQPIKGFRVGGGAYWGKANYIKPLEISKKEHVRNRFFASTDYKSEKLYCRAEYVYANDGGINKEGIHGTAYWYFIPEKLNAVAKIDYFNANKSLNTEVLDYTAGVNYYFYKNCRLQLNYTYSDYMHNEGWNNTKNSHIVAAQMQFVF